MIQKTRLHQKGKIINYIAQWKGGSLQTSYIQGPAPGCITLCHNEKLHHVKYFPFHTDAQKRHLQRYTFHTVDQKL